MGILEKFIVSKWMPLVKIKNPFVLVKVKGHLGHWGQTENRVNVISQHRKHRLISYLVCGCPMVRARTVICGGGKRSSGVTGVKL